jgi:hypothetical protein
MEVVARSFRRNSSPGHRRVIQRDEAGATRDEPDRDRAHTEALDDAAPLDARVEEDAELGFGRAERLFEREQ